MEAGVAAGPRPQEAVGAPLVDGGPDDLVALAVDPAGPAEVALQAALGDEPVERLLGQARRLDVGQLPPSRHRLDQRAGDDDEAQPERCRQVLGEGADVEHPPGPVQPVERLQRAVGVAVLGVVVVLDDGHVVLLGEGEEGPTPGQAHGRPGRRLVRRRRVEEAHVGRDLVDEDALVVDGHRGDLHAHGPPEVPDRGVARLLDRDVVAGSEQDPGHEVDGLLGAGGDDQVLGRCLDAPRAADPVGQGAAAVPSARRGRRSSRGPVGGRRPRTDATRRGERATDRSGRSAGRTRRRRGPGAPSPGAAGRRAGGRTPPVPWWWAGPWWRRTCHPRPVPRGSPRPRGGRTPWSRSAARCRAGPPAPGSAAGDRRRRGGPR